MNFHVLTLFPEMIEQGLHTSILGKAMEKGCITLETTNIRDFSANKYNRVDDYPYGGGAGGSVLLCVYRRQRETYLCQFGGIFCQRQYTGDAVLQSCRGGGDNGGLPADCLPHSVYSGRQQTEKPVGAAAAFYHADVD